MRKHNGQRFHDALQTDQYNPTSLTASSGESPVHPVTPEAPAAPSPGLSFPSKVLIARPEHAKFVSHLQKKFSNCLGFLPTAALQWYIEQKRVGIAFENDEPAGYVLGRTHYRYQPLMRPITQAAVAFDAQKRHHGLTLVDRVCQQAIAAKQLVVQACCAADLEANEFWRIAGFEAVDLLEPDNARGRGIIVWRKSLHSRAPDWFLTPPVAAGHRGRKVIR